MTIRIFEARKKPTSKSGKDKKVGKVMGEYKKGTLKTNTGKKVTDKKQAFAIAASEAGLNETSKKLVNESLEDFLNNL